jgi:hypothetical protein
LARYGQNVLVRWDENDPRTDPYLEAGLMLALFLVSRRRPVGDAGDLAALRDVEERIEAELARLDKMEKSSDGIRRHNEDLAGELRKARNQFTLLLSKAKDTLRALNIEMLDEVGERGAPLVLPGETRMPDTATGGSARWDTESPALQAPEAER